MTIAIYLTLCFVAVGPEYFVTDLGTLGGDISEAYAINNRGQIVGFAYEASYRYQAFIWQGGTGIQRLALPADTYNSQAVGINDAGEVCGSRWAFWNSPERALAWDVHGTPRLLPGFPQGGRSAAYDINDLGTIVGYAETLTLYQIAVRWDDGILHDLHLPATSCPEVASAINEHSHILANSHDWFSVCGSFLCNGPFVITLPSSLLRANDLNNELVPTVVGGLYPYGYGGDAFRWRNGVLINLGKLSPSDFMAEALSINAVGTIVGYSDSDSYGDQATIWIDDQIADLNTLIDPRSGWFLQVANDINDAGQIVGYGINADDETHAFVLTPLDSAQAFMCFPHCMAGPDSIQTGQCSLFDFDDSDTVDLADYAVLQRAIVKE